MKIFISYSRRDAGDFADQIQKRFTSSEQYEVFTDVNSIRVGDVWSNTIQDNISNCDFFVAIITHGALQSGHVENEVLQAQRQSRRIIPCFYRNVRDSDIKWGLNKIQGVEFEEKYELARNLYSKIASKQPKPPKPSGKPEEEGHDDSISIQKIQKPRSKAKLISLVFISIIVLFFLLYLV